MTEATETTTPVISAEQARKAFDAGFAFASAEYGWFAAGKVAIAAIKAAGGADQTPVRHRFMMGYMARRFLKATGDDTATDELREKAEVMFYAKPNGAELKAGQIARTKVWEQAHVAARAAWSRLLKAHDLKSSDKRGGARPKAAKAEGESEAREESAPLAKDKPTANKWLAQESGILNAFVLRNKEHVPEPVLALVDQFRKDLLALLKD
jgi:hypothetical protein